MRRASIRKPRTAARFAELATALLDDGGRAVSTLQALSAEAAGKVAIRAAGA